MAQNQQLISKKPPKSFWFPSTFICYLPLTSSLGTCLSFNCVYTTLPLGRKILTRPDEDLPLFCEQVGVWLFCMLITCSGESLPDPPPCTSSAPHAPFICLETGTAGSKLAAGFRGLILSLKWLNSVIALGLFLTYPAVLRGKSRWLMFN